MTGVFSRYNCIVSSSSFVSREAGSAGAARDWGLAALVQAVGLFVAADCCGNPCRLCHGFELDVRFVRL